MASSSSSKQPKDTPAETKLTDEESESLLLAEEFFSNLRRLQELEAELRSVRIRHQNLLAAHPFLGTLLGEVRRVKRKRKEKETPAVEEKTSSMEVDEPKKAPEPRKKEEGPRERLEKKIRREAHVADEERLRSLRRDLREQEETGRRRG